MIKRPSRPTIISIQSQVVHGHVGNSAAVFPMQVLGIEVAAVPTVLLSNRPGYPTLRGRALDAGLVGDLLQGIEERGLCEAASALVTGYLGSAEVAAMVAAFVERARARNPGLFYVCDPVIGDDGRVFVADGVAEVIRDRLLPLATLATPNHFELEWLFGAKVETFAALSEAVARVQAAGVRNVAVTGAVLADTAEGQLEAVLAEGARLTRIPAQKLPMKGNGTGDLFAALLTAHHVNGLSLPEAAHLAVRTLSAVLRRTADEATGELALTVADLLPG